MADSIEWALTDLGPGPGVYLTGGDRYGTVWVAGMTTFTIPAVSVTADINAPNGAMTTLHVEAHPKLLSANSESCTSHVTVSSPSDVALGGGAPVFQGGPNRPNPFHASTRIHFSLDRPERATVRVYTLDGRLIRTLADRPLAAGAHEVSWDGTDVFGAQVGSGIYFYKITTASGKTASGRMLLAR
jgi:hypothetical protein